jgi:transposase
LKRRPKRPPPPPKRDYHLDLASLAAVVEELKGVVRPEAYQQLQAASETLRFLLRELHKNTVAIKRLKRWLFGGSEKSDEVLGNQESDDQSKTDEKTDEKTDDQNKTDQKTDPPQGTTDQPPGGPCAGDTTAEQPQGETKPDDVNGKKTGQKDTKQGKTRKPGHGRHGIADYPRAKHISVPHASLHHGDHCPAPGCTGKVYHQKEPWPLIRIIGMGPLDATVWDCERLRCNLCLDMFTATAPPGVGEEKYDESATAMIGLLKYDTGVPFNRLEKLQAGLGIPMPASTQWELVEAGAVKLRPLFEELLRQAAQADVVYDDDTSVRILALSDEERQAALGDDAAGRTGVFTTGLVTTRTNGPPIVLFFSGPRHCGENLDEVLKQRAPERSPPIQMSDAASTNSSGDAKTVPASCNAHGRRHFVDIVDLFPAECRKVLEAFRVIYKNDAVAKEQEMCPQQRLEFHQQQSGPTMNELEQWMRQQLAEHKVEENSELGQAMHYLLNHWPKLTLFLKVAGAPLDNNLCEQVLKVVLRHRKNSLFYKTLHGAEVGDLYMSLIHTATLNHIGEFDYLVTVLRQADQVALSPADWLPWNYQQTLNQLSKPGSESSDRTPATEFAQAPA